MSTQMPKPTTLVAFLPLGNGRRRATLHKYVETREFDLVDERGKPMRDGGAYEFIFACTETGLTRRWGTAHRATHIWEKDGN